MQSPNLTTVALLLAAALSPISLTAVTWNGSDGNFTDAGSWGGTVPGSSTTAEVKNGSTVTIDSNVSPKNLEIAGGSTVNQTAGTVTTSDQNRIGMNGAGAYILSGSSILSTSSTMRIGQSDNGNGSVLLSGSAKVHQTATGDSSYLWISNGKNSVGSVKLTGNSSWIIEGTGSDSINVGRWSDGETATATLTLEDHTLLSTKGEVAIANNGSHGTINLSGNAVFEAKKFWSADVSRGAFNANGGTIRATSDANTINFLQNITLNLGDNGVTIDTNGASIGEGLNFGTTLITGVGGLTKAGLGTLTLGQAHNYTGATVVKEGTLALNVGGNLAYSSALKVEADATLKLTDPTQINYTAALHLAADSTLNLDFTVPDTLEVGMLFIAGQAVAIGEYDEADFAQWLINYNITVDLGSATGTIIKVNAVPEPSTYALLGATALAGLISLRRRKS